MRWRERFGGDDERAEVAARARALLSTAGVTARAAPPPPPVEPSVPPVAGAALAPRWPSAGPARGGWVPGEPVASGGPPITASDTAPAGPVAGVALAGVDHGLVPEPAHDLPDLTDDGRGRHARHRPTSDWSSPLTPVAPVVTPWRERIRFDPGRRGLVAVAAVVVVIGSVAGGVLFRGGESSAVTVAAAAGLPGASAAPVEGGNAATAPGTPASAPAPGAAVGTGSAGPTGTAVAGTVTVDVAGLVARPGVYTLPTGSRVEDALTAAGGPLPGADLASVNRARVLVDGEQLAVAVPGAVAPVAGSSGGAAGGATAVGLVDLNTAGLADLDTLPGVGPVLAQAILDFRTDHGKFSSVDDLQQVSGIGPSRFDDLKDLVTV